MTAPAETPLPRAEMVVGAEAVAVDFETANGSRSSPCSVGLAWIQDGRVTHTAHRLIRPSEIRFNSRNMQIHGIHPEDVADKPEFPVLWAELRTLVDGSLVLAHNASFDMSVLRSTLDAYGLPWPSCPYLCTVKLASAAWPGRMSYKLSGLAKSLGLDLSHHQAESDAVACAEIALAAARVAKHPDLIMAARRLGIGPGRIGRSEYQSCSGASSAPVIPEIPSHVDLGGAVFVFTGQLPSMTRACAMELVEKAGGQVGRSVTRATTYLVVGSAPGGIKTGAAENRKVRGSPVQILNEDEFLEMLGV